MIIFFPQHKGNEWGGGGLEFLTLKGMTERTLFRELMAIREEEVELPAILTHILGKSLQDAHFDHYHFPRVHCVSVHVLHTGRQWLVNVCVYTNVLLSSDFLSICQGVYSRFIVQEPFFLCPRGHIPT